MTASAHSQLWGSVMSERAIAAVAAVAMIGSIGLTTTADAVTPSDELVDICVDL